MPKHLQINKEQPDPTRTHKSLLKKADIESNPALVRTIKTGSTGATLPGLSVAGSVSQANNQARSKFNKLHGKPDTSTGPLY